MQRYDIINRFISERGYRSFLEIGTDNGETFRRITAPEKTSVDPDQRTNATFHMTSDAFFSSYDNKYDIIFIDGLHEHKQVMRDIHNALSHLNTNGVIILHDCTPSSEYDQQYSEVSISNRPWLGTVWKTYVAARATLPYEMCVLVNYNGDSSCGIIDTSRRREYSTSDLPTDMESLTFDDYKTHPEWMNFRPVYDYSLITQHTYDKPRIAFMFGTRDWYHRMSLSLKSLLKYTRLDHVYLMIEDDTFPEELPSFISCVNVSNQQYFPHDGPNFKSIYSYMVLLRVALPIMYPDIDRALCIDADTLTSGDISGIWDVDMSDYYLAAVKELRQQRGSDYYNCGVMLMNFAKLRNDNIPEQAINLLNTKYFPWKEQDVLNDYCRHHIYTLPSKYNHATNVTAQPGSPHIVRHYIGNSNAKNAMMSDAEMCNYITWDDIIRFQKGR